MRTERIAPRSRARFRLIAPHSEGMVGVAVPMDHVGGVLVTAGPPPRLYRLLHGRARGDTPRGMKSTPTQVVAYLRVSTAEQAKSGLGIEAQRAAVEQLTADIGGRIVRVIVEQGSGADDDRPGLVEALELAERLRGVVAVARLDRLSRDLAKVAETLKAGVQIRCADSPNASTLELHLRATIAQEERRLISERTKQALRAKSARGEPLGFARKGARSCTTHDGRSMEAVLREGQLRGAQANATRGEERRALVLREAAPIIEANQGASLRGLAALFEAAGILTVRGSSTWTPAGVSKLIETWRRRSA
jgi:DNA invertase Pin-like site-specific DNA recombinase